MLQVRRWLTSTCSPCAAFVRRDDSLLRCRHTWNHRRLIDAGVVDFAVHDGSRGSSSIQLLCSGVTLDRGRVSVPVIVVASYLFDSLPADLYKVVADDGAIDGCAASVASPPKRRRTAGYGKGAAAAAAAETRATTASGAARPHSPPAVVLEGRVTSYARRKQPRASAARHVATPAATVVTPVVVDRLAFTFCEELTEHGPVVAACLPWLARHMEPSCGSEAGPPGLVLVPSAGLQLLADMRSLQACPSLPFVLLLADKTTVIGDDAFGPSPHTNPVVRDVCCRMPALTCGESRAVHPRGHSRCPAGAPRRASRTTHARRLRVCWGRCCRCRAGVP